MYRSPLSQRFVFNASQQSVELYRSDVLFMIENGK